jgi:hypothetical protein
MRCSIAAALALIAASSLPAQTESAVPDLTTATPIGGNWSWTQTSEGSQATFTDANSKPKLIVRCARSTRRVSISKAASSTAQSRNLRASFDSASGRLRAELAAFDPLLDALATSRGRIGVIVAGTPALVVPAWAELARVVEDCRV